MLMVAAVLRTVTRCNLRPTYMLLLHPIKICSVGARALGMSLQNNVTLKTLNLRLNSIADQGGNALFICVSIACGAKEETMR